LLIGRGHSCVVVALSLIPMKSADRVKTDRQMRECWQNYTVPAS
jgi:hypothetical protein